MPWQRDLLAVVQSIVLLLVLAVVVINFLVDVAYTSIDPRLGGPDVHNFPQRPPRTGHAPEASVRERALAASVAARQPGLVIGGALILLVGP